MSELARLNSKPSPQETTPEKPLFLLPSGLLLAGDEAWPQIHLHGVISGCACCGSEAIFASSRSLPF